MTGRLQFAVFGQPIAHSLSPRIHAMFAAQFGIALDYRAIAAGHDDFVRALEAFAREGGVGANVTLPLKQDAATLCSSVSARARRCGSVNTLIRVAEGWRGDSTDGSGFLRDLAEHHGFEPHGHRCLLLGAGGAARAVAFALADADVAHLAIANRTHERARALAAAIGVKVRAIGWSDLAAADPFDLVVHATAAGHTTGKFNAPARIVATQTLCYDLSYGQAAAPFLRWARAAGAKYAADGFGMLIEQAADAFAIWHGRRPNTGPTHAALRRDLAASPSGA